MSKHFTNLETELLHPVIISDMEEMSLRKFG